MEQCFNHDNSYNISVTLKHQNFAGEDFNKVVGLEEDGFQLCKSSSNNYFWRHRNVQVPSLLQHRLFTFLY